MVSSLADEQPFWPFQRSGRLVRRGGAAWSQADFGASRRRPCEKSTPDSRTHGRAARRRERPQAIRSSSWVYVEYADGEKEYDDRATDPDELHNIYAALLADQKASLRAMVSGLRNCHDAASCSAADGSTRSATRQ